MSTATSQAAARGAPPSGRKPRAAERSLAIALGLATIAVGALTAVAFRTTGDFAHSADLVAHTLEMRSLLSEVLTRTLEGEAGERGFVITGEEPFLEPFKAGEEGIRATLERLRLLTRGDPSDERDLHTLRALVGRALDFHREVIVARRDSAADAVALVRTGEGVARRDAVLRQVAMMKDIQERRLREHFETLRLRHRAVLVALAVFTVLTLVLVGVLFLVLRRDTRGRRAERKFRGLVESAPEGIIIVDRDGRITLVNARTEALFGYERNELIGELVEILIPERARARHPALRDGYVASPRTRPMGGSAGLSLFGRRKDGSEMPVEISLSPLDSQDGTLTCAVVRDVTERWRADMALREARALADSIVETIREPLVVLDAELRIERANEAFLRRFGYAAADIERRVLAEIGERQWNVAELQQHLAEVLVGGRGFQDLEIEQEWALLEGPRTMRISALPIHRAGARTEEILLGVEDVTDRKRAVQFLLEREALERTNRELQEFAYVASHDLQEPLRKIQAFGDRLGKGYASSLPTEAADFIDRMQNAATRMRRLIDDLLAFSRVTTQARSFESVDLAEAAREVMSDLEVRIEQSGGRVEIEALPAIEGDPSQLRQLLQNLVANALKFRRPDVPPVVTIRARVLEPAVRQRRGPGPTCQLEVEDNGIGFEEKYLDRIFTIFQRLHGRNAFEGTGLGLAICRKIVERHHGRITARSVVGSGSTFIVTLPTRQPGEPGEEKVNGGIGDDGDHAAHGG